MSEFAKAATQIADRAIGGILLRYELRKALNIVTAVRSAAAAVPGVEHHPDGPAYFTAVDGSLEGLVEAIRIMDGLIESLRPPQAVPVESPALPWEREATLHG